MPNTPYENFILENKLYDILLTKLTMSNFMTVDTSLSTEDGMKKIIHTYKAVGDVEDVTEGSGNTTDITVGYTESEYDVITTQGRFVYTDEALMKDKYLVDTGITGLGNKLTNKMTSRLFGEWGKATIQHEYNTLSIDDIIDAIALLNKEDAEEQGLFAMISPKMKATVRKAAKDELKYVEAFARNGGYIGNIFGVPFYTNKAALSDDDIIIASKAAVTCFTKKNTTVEQERDGNHRKNTVYGRFVNVIALTDENEVVRLSKPASTAVTITTKASGAKTVAGAATTGATVYVYINGVLSGTTEATSSAYSYSAKENLSAGDIIDVVARIPGEVSTVASATVS